MRKLLVILFILASVLLLSSCENMIVETSIMSSITETNVSSSDNTPSYPYEKSIKVGNSKYSMSLETSENGYLIYKTNNNEKFYFDTKTGRLITFQLNCNMTTNTQITEQKAIQISNEFLSTQESVDNFVKAEVYEKTDSFVVRYEHKHLGYCAEWIEIHVLKDGTLNEYVTQLDLDKTFLSVKKIDKEKLNESIRSLLENDDFSNVEIVKWRHGKDNLPALEVNFMEIQYPDCYTNATVTLSEDGPYIAEKEWIACH